MSIERAQAFVELSRLEPVFAELGYEVAMNEATATMQIDRPAVESDALFSIGLLPSPADGIRLVECDAAYRFGIAEGVDADMYRSLSIITQAMPVGHLDLAADGRVHARWAIATDAAAVLDQDLIVTSIVMFDLLQQHFGDYVEGVCEGDIVSQILPELMRQAGDSV